MTRLLLAIISLVFVLPLSAQDIHFSQFNASPLTLNPALTGKLECTYRATINYRNQWNSIPAPYETYSAAFDAALLKNKLKGSAIGIGVIAFNDRSGDGNLSHMNAGLNLAYHQQLAEGHFLSVGFQGAYIQKSINTLQLIFGNQIGPGGIIQGANSGENFTGPINYIDLNVGMHWSSVISDNFAFNLGGAYYHLLEPTESFLGDQSNTLPARYVGHGGFSVTLGTDWSMSPSVLYMRQAAAQQINVGSSFGYHMDEAALYFGAWHRRAGGNGDAMIALLGLEFSSLLFGFSYDITMSDLLEANKGQGGFELSLSYNGCIEAKRKITHCPKF